MLCNLIRTTNPDIITGYNIFGYDFEYIEQRSKMYGGLKNIGRITIIGQSNGIERLSRRNGKVQVEAITNIITLKLSVVS